jgi:hypothetical protein
MDNPKPAGELLATVDVRELNTLWWGPMRVMFPRFVEEVELGRFLKTLLASGRCRAVHIELHRQPDGSPSPHVFDVYGVGEPA